MSSCLICLFLLQGDALVLVEGIATVASNLVPTLTRLRLEYSGEFKLYHQLKAMLSDREEAHSTLALDDLFDAMQL